MFVRVVHGVSKVTRGRFVDVEEKDGDSSVEVAPPTEKDRLLE